MDLGNNFVTINLDRYNELLTAETELQYAKQILFNKNNRLNYDKSGVYFEIDENQAKLIFPTDYHLHFIGLQKKAEE